MALLRLPRRRERDQDERNAQLRGLRPRGRTDRRDAGLEAVAQLPGAAAGRHGEDDLRETLGDFVRHPTVVLGVLIVILVAVVVLLSFGSDQPARGAASRGAGEEGVWCRHRARERGEQRRTGRLRGRTAAHYAARSWVSFAFVYDEL